MLTRSKMAWPAPSPRMKSEIAAAIASDGDDGLKACAYWAGSSTSFPDRTQLVMSFVARAKVFQPRSLTSATSRSSLSLPHPGPVVGPGMGTATGGELGDRFHNTTPRSRHRGSGCASSAGIGASEVSHVSFGPKSNCCGLKAAQPFVSRDGQMFGGQYRCRFRPLCCCPHCCCSLWSRPCSTNIKRDKRGLVHARAHRLLDGQAVHPFLGKFNRHRHVELLLLPAVTNHRDARQSRG